ncbi:MAG: hypothetical protein ABIH59_02785 [archaeon]
MNLLENENSIKGKLEQTSEDFRKIFLLKFAKELIKHSKEEFFALEHELRKKEKPTKKEKEVERIIKKEEPFLLSLMHRDPRPIRKEEITSLPPQVFKTLPRLTPMPPRRRMPSPLRIPEYPLPPRLQYLKPSPTNTQIDLGKLNVLTQDPGVISIECNGPDEFIMIKGNMGTKTTNIVLNKEEINYVLKTFSQASKIPIHEGVYKIVVGRFILLAIVSEVVGSKFIIRKMIPQMPVPRPSMNFPNGPRY